MRTPTGDIHSKTPGSDLTRKWSTDARPIFGSDPTRKPGQTDLESESERHLWLRFRVSLTQVPDQSDPEMGLAKWDPFRVKSDPGVFKVYAHCSMLRSCTARIDISFSISCGHLCQTPHVGPYCKYDRNADSQYMK